MQLFRLLILLTAASFSGCKLVKSGVFDNVTVHAKGRIQEVILIDFDDSLSKHLVNKPSEIIIRNQFIPKLEEGSISDLPEVENITFVHNGLRKIRPGAFRNLPKLKVLNLSNNAIEEIHRFVFNSLVVEDLYLDNNQISRIDDRAFSNLHLRKLFLNNNKISGWRRDWFADSSVLVLDMSSNLIEDLPPNSFRLMSEPVNGSMSLIFSRNHLKKIDNHVFNGFEKFKSIFLDSNSIDRLGAGVFNGVKYINTVNFNNNSLTEFSADLLKNTRVDVLMVEDNKLKCLSTDLFHMEELDIDGNPISCFCVQTWLDWREFHSNPSIYHITDLEEDCL